MQLRSIKICLCGTSRFDDAAHMDSNRQSEPLNIKKELQWTVIIHLSLRNAEILFNASIKKFK